MLDVLRYDRSVKHVSDADLLLYSLGYMRSVDELGPIEEHLLWCGPCLDRAEEIDNVFSKLGTKASQGLCSPAAPPLGYHWRSSWPDR
jgi:hypothetical protein